MIELKIHKYITENNNEIAKQILFDTFDKKQKILLISPMKTGKTTFIMNYLSDILRASNMQLIFVTPVKSLMNDIKNKYPIIIKCNGNVKQIKLNDNIPILTTPESMHKVISTCEEENKEFFIVYDEMHQVVSNADFRRALYEVLEYYNKEVCKGFLGMTATPEPLENINFDKKFEIVVENKFIQADKTIIVKDFKSNIDNKLNFIKYMKKLNNDKLVIARINNKEDIKLMKPKLNNCAAWYRSKDESQENSDYIKDMESLENTLNGQDLKGIDYLLCTSLIDVGVEIQLEEKPIVIDFLDNNSTIIDDIQFVGRFRKGIDKLYLVGKLNNLEPNTKPLNFKKEYQKKLEKTKKFINYLNEINENVEKTETHLNATGIKYNEDNLMYQLDEYGLMQSEFKKHINFYLQTDVYLKLFLEKHPTFNSNEISNLSYNNLKITESNELKQEKKKLKDEIEEYETKFLEKTKLLNLDDKLLKLILNYNLIQDKDLWKIKKYECLCNTWKQENLEEYRKRYYQTLELLEKTNIKQVDMLEMALKEKNIKDLIKRLNFIEYNKLYNNKKELKEIKINKDILRLYRIRDYINKTKGKERDVYLSDKFKLELLDHLQKEKSLSKMSAKQLDKHLSMIYNISYNNQKKYIITSIKTVF